MTSALALWFSFLCLVRVVLLLLCLRSLSKMCTWCCKLLSPPCCSYKPTNSSLSFFSFLLSLFLSPAISEFTMDSFVWGELHLPGGLFECTLCYTYTHTHTPILFHVSIVSWWQGAIMDNLPSPQPYPAFCLHQHSHSYHCLGAAGKLVSLNGNEVLGAPEDICILQQWMYTKYIKRELLALDLFKSCQ